MAHQVNQARNRTEDIELQLSEAEFAWSELPEVEREIGEWDDVEALVFIEEWPLQEMRLDRLAEDEEQMTDEQKSRYRRLLSVVERNRPIVERLRKS